MKKLLALLLAGLMLIGFGVVASAETPEELEAEIVQPMEDLRGDSALKIKLSDFTETYWKYLRATAMLSLPTPTNIFAEFYGAFLYPGFILMFLGCLLISPVMLILQLALPLIP